MKKALGSIESDIIDTFAQISSSLGYSEVHGKILAALMISGKPISLEELAGKTRYSAGMISLSLDLLEVLGMIKKVKRVGDRRLYIELCGNLTETLKTAILLKLTKGLVEVKEKFSEYREKITGMRGTGKIKLLKNLSRLESQTSKIEKYINKLSEVPIPK